MKLADMQKEELIAVAQRQEEELAAERADSAKLREALAGVQSRMGGLIKEKAASSVFCPECHSRESMEDQPVAGELPPLPTTPADALKELTDVFYLNVECSRAEHVVGLVEAAISQPVQQPAAVWWDKPVGGFYLSATSIPDAAMKRGGIVPLYMGAPAAGGGGGGPVMGISISGNEPDSGRDAALEMKKAIIAVISYGHSHSEAPTAKFAKELLGAIERDDRVAKALAAHPAPSSDAGLVDIAEQARDLVEGAEKAESGYLVDPIAYEHLSAALKFHDAHPANGAQAGE